MYKELTQLGDVYDKLSCIPFTTDKDLTDVVIFINAASHNAFITADDETDKKSSKLKMITTLVVPYPEKLNERIINMTSSKLGLDWDGDAVRYSKFVACRDYFIKRKLSLRIQVRWYKTLLKLRTIKGKLFKRSRRWQS